MVPHDAVSYSGRGGVAPRITRKQAMDQYLKLLFPEEEEKMKRKEKKSAESEALQRKAEGRRGSAATPLSRATDGVCQLRRIMMFLQLLIALLQYIFEKQCVRQFPSDAQHLRAMTPSWEGGDSTL